MVTKLVNTWLDSNHTLTNTAMCKQGITWLWIAGLLNAAVEPRLQRTGAPSTLKITSHKMTRSDAHQGRANRFPSALAMTALFHSGGYCQLIIGVRIASGLCSRPSRQFSVLATAAARTTCRSIDPFHRAKSWPAGIQNQCGLPRATPQSTLLCARTSRSRAVMMLAERELKIESSTRGHCRQQKGESPQKPIESTHCHERGIR